MPEFVGTIVVAGNIGAGKTTLSRAVAQELGRSKPLAPTLFLESVDDNPFLERFYADPPRWVFQLNMYFLASRSQQLLHAGHATSISVFDRSIYEDLIFVDQALEDGVTTKENHKVFVDLFEVLVSTLPPPTVLVYLRSSPRVLLERIQGRGREFEGTITSDYLERLDSRYAEWRSSYSSSPVYDIDADTFDCSDGSQDVHDLVDAVSLYLPQAGA